MSEINTQPVDAPPDTPTDAVPAAPGTGTLRLVKAGTPVAAVPDVPAPVPAWLRAGRAVRGVAAHDRTRTTCRAVARNGLYVAGGAGILARRAWDGRSAARYERMIRACEVAGQYEEAKEWEERGRQFRAARHARRMDLLTAPQRLAKGAAVGTAATAGGLLGLGIIMAIADKDATEVIVPLTWAIDTARLILLVASVVWGPFIIAAPWLALLALWNVGRRGQAAPQWALPTHQRDDGAPITPSVVVTALRDLGIAALRGAIKEMGDAGAAMLSPIVIAGCGVEVDVTLPTGVSTEEIQARRRKLAENLGRHEHEVFITIPTAARTVRLWIADSGALDEPIGPSPLVTDTDQGADYKSGRAPWGVDLRGDQAAISLYQRHLLITGLSNQGKTASLRALALWLALDPTVEFRIGDLKGAGDWNPFDGLATVLIEGPTDEHVIAVTEMVEEGVAEMNRRLQAPKGTPFPPLVLIVDEAQVAFMCPVKEPGRGGRPYGGSKATSRYFMAVRKLHNQGRAVNVTLWEGTQDPTNENLPKLVREGAHIRAALVLGTESQAKMALGDKAVDGGAAPHKLRQGIDKGVLVVAGDGIKLAPGQSSITIRTHFIDDPEAAELADRAKARRRGVTTLHRVEPTEQVDPLADIAAVLGAEPRVRTQEVLQRLVERNPGEYREWKFGDLKEVLEAADAAPHKSDGVMVVDRQKVLDALAERDTE